jgi:hypothetical protein
VLNSWLLVALVAVTAFSSNAEEEASMFLERVSSRVQLEEGRDSKLLTTFVVLWW